MTAEISDEFMIGLRVSCLLLGAVEVAFKKPRFLGPFYKNLKTSKVPILGF